MAKNTAGVVDAALLDIALYSVRVTNTLLHGYGDLLKGPHAETREFQEMVQRTIFDEWDAGVPVEQCAFLLASAIQRGAWEEDRG